MGYTGPQSWKNYMTVIDRARSAGLNVGLDVDAHFSLVSQLSDAGNLGPKRRMDYHLTRQAAYLVAMNGDPRKAQVAAAQAYFAQSALIREGHMSNPDPQQSSAAPTGVPVETFLTPGKLPLTCHFVGADNTATPCDLPFQGHPVITPVTSNFNVNVDRFMDDHETVGGVTDRSPPTGE